MTCSLRSDTHLDPAIQTAMSFPSLLLAVGLAVVVGPGLAFTDAYATAVFVMGSEGLAWMDTKDGYAALAITTDDRVVGTPGMEPYLVR